MSVALSKDEQRKPPLAARRRSLVDLVHEEIHKRITDGGLAIGQRLVIDQLAEEFGTSLIPVREALARLNAERLVTFEANKGYRVAPAPDQLELRQMLEARLMLEVGSLEGNLEALTPEVIKELNEINRKMPASAHGTTYEGYAEFVALNARFHEGIVKLSGNEFIIDAYSRLGYHQRITQTLHGRGVPDINKIVAEHDVIIDALKRRSVDDARAAIRSHIVGAAERLYSDEAAKATGTVKKRRR